MKKRAVKITLILSAIVLISALALFAYYLIITAGVNLDKNKLVDLNSSVEIYDVKGEMLEELSDGKTVTDAGEIPSYTLNAFVAIEDKRFYSHGGTDFKGFLRAAFNNIKSFSFKEGASTISQQLIKNTHLSGEKTLKRKFAELKLAGQLEKNYSKKEILEMYVNTIYFGDGCYGITKAATNYFGVLPSELTINQSAALAGMIKAPAIYSPKISPKNCNARKNLVLKEMLNQNYITKTEYDDAVSVDISTVNGAPTVSSPYIELVKDELNAIVKAQGLSQTKFKVYTYYDKNLQRILDETLDNVDTDADKKAIILNKNNKIQAFYSTCGDEARQLGSTIKPLAVFAPAIEMGVIDSCTPINDEKINFNGYAPSNYKDQYYGYVSAKYALAKSLNSCAVKILNDCGTENCIKYLSKTDIPLSDDDNSLSIALGATEKGATLSQIAGAYGTFVNKGVYTTPTVIKKIETADGKKIYEDSAIKRLIFSEETAFILNDMLKETVLSGTAKTLSALNVSLSAKTGTVGTEDGNTDAYSVSYNGDYITSTWLGKTDGTLMTNDVSGGTLPTKISFNIWQTMMNNGYTPHDTFYCDSVQRIPIDKISYENYHTILSADENFPSRYVQYEFFKKDRVPKTVSDRFSLPKIENGKISVNFYQIDIRLCLPNYCFYKLFRECEGFKILVYDSAQNMRKTQYTDRLYLPDTVYRYSAIPYVKTKNGIKYGEEYFFEEIKTPSVDLADDGLWQDFLSIVGFD